MGRNSFVPPDPRNLLASRADPEHRAARKELEKKHPFGYKEPLLLTMLGIGLIWNIEKQVKDKTERKMKDEQEKEEKEERRRRRRERDIRAGTWDPMRDDTSRGSFSDRGGGGSDRGSNRGTSRDAYEGRGYSRGPAARPRFYHDDEDDRRYGRRNADHYDDRYDERYDDRRGRSVPPRYRSGTL